MKNLNNKWIHLSLSLIFFLLFFLSSINTEQKIVSVFIPGSAGAEDVGSIENDKNDEFDDEFADEFDDEFADEFDEDYDSIDVYDPLEPVNRAFFYFNDKLYFWVLKPVSKGYATIIAEDIRICIRNAFKNLLMPVRFVNNLLQGKFRNAGVEVSRFLINTTAGIAGFGDPAKDIWGLTPRQEDLGQTFGFYGIGNGIYFCWPLFGPSTLRDTAGMVGDTFLDPLHYLRSSDSDTWLALQAGKIINNTSLVIGDYEALKDASFDPYIALRDAYLQQRDKKVRDLK